MTRRYGPAGLRWCSLLVVAGVLACGPSLGGDGGGEGDSDGNSSSSSIGPGSATTSVGSTTGSEPACHDDSDCTPPAHCVDGSCECGPCGCGRCIDVPWTCDTQLDCPDGLPCAGGWCGIGLSCDWQAQCTSDHCFQGSCQRYACASGCADNGLCVDGACAGPDPVEACGDVLPHIATTVPLGASGAVGLAAWRSATDQTDLAVLFASGEIRVIDGVTGVLSALYATGGAATALVAADLDGAGTQGLVVVGPGEPRWLGPDGSGGLDPAVTFGGGFSGSAVAATVDLGDSTATIAVLDPATQQVSVWAASGGLPQLSTTWDAPAATAIAVHGGGPLLVLAGPDRADSATFVGGRDGGVEVAGISDLAAFNGPPLYGATASTLQGPKFMIFRRSLPDPDNLELLVDLPTEASDVVTTDLDADGSREFAVALGTQGALWIQRFVDPMLGCTAPLAGLPAAQQLAAGDLDGDGIDDLAALAGDSVVLLRSQPAP